MAGKKGKLKIINYSWHLAHQHELLKLPNTSWFWVANNVRPNVVKRVRDKVEYPNLSYVPYYESGKYDLALLHIDQATVDIDPKLAKGKNVLACDINEQITDIPKIVINHGTPYWPELYNQETGRYSSDWLKYKCKEFIGASLMVVNSHAAKEEWGVENSRVIVHGLDPAEWYDFPEKELRVITTLSPAGWDSYYGRVLQSEVKHDLKNIYGIPLIHIGVDWVADGFEQYRQFIAHSLIYFNPTHESPMPRARTEAMLSGACIVTTASHDADLYFNCDTRDLWRSYGKLGYIKAVEQVILAAKDRINGFIVPENPEPITMLINWLFNHYRITRKIGQTGKMFAMREFNIDRFQRDWAKLLKEVTGKDIL